MKTRMLRPYVSLYVIWGEHVQSWSVMTASYAYTTWTNHIVFSTLG